MLRGRLYRATMRLAHRFSWHYAPISAPIEPTGERQRWCQWCGFWHYAPISAPIEPTGERQRWCQWCGFRATVIEDKVPS